MDYNELCKSIEHWNEYRVPILRISLPDKNLNFQGAMRFYFQDSGQKFATKCVNVTSSDTTKDVIDRLIEKFRPDMRMLSVPEYGLYEIHENGDERKLNLDERPLFVQLEWNQDDREGRFLLRRLDEKTRDFASQSEEPSLKRKLSKKEKKKNEKIKKQQQKEQEKDKKKNGIAERFYNEVPTTSFTRSISNPDAVMRRRRAQKLEKRLQELSLEGGQKADVTLRIYGETINKNVSYKTLLLSTKCTAASVVKQILEKYGKDQEDPNDYCLVHLIVPLPAASANGDDNHSVPDLNSSTALRECILDDDDCPLLINRNHDDPNSIATFHICRKPADYQKRRKKKPSKAQVQANSLHPLVVQQLNQRLQINNNNSNFSEQYSNQNSSSQNSSQSDPPPPPFETVHSMPTLYANNNGNMLQYQQQPASMSTLPPRFNMHSSNNIHAPMNGTMPRQNYIQFPQMQINPNENHQYRPATNIPEQQVQHPPPPPPQRASLQILPALIRVEEDVEDIFLNHVITLMEPTEELKFRLTPTYVLYMVSRYRASTQFHPELEAQRRAELFMPFTKKIATMIRNTIEVHMRDPAALAFWLANSSDLNHFYKQDKHLSPFTLEAQGILRNSIIASFKYLLASKQLELDTVLHNFFDENDDLDQVDPRTGQPRSSSVNHILNVLNDTMAIMRKNRVNAALTIQIFSHLFHHLNKWLFNRLIGVYDRQPNLANNQPNFAIYCTRTWGIRLHRRLAMIQSWAEGQGLEQAADFHLARVIQVTIFLSRHYPSKINSQHLKDAIDSCDRLNPVQKRALLQRYKPDPEQTILRAMIENFVYTMDYSYVSAEYPLEEDVELNIRFLIPEDGYSSEIIKDVPPRLVEYVGQLCGMNVRGRQLCLFTIQELSCGSWQVYFKDYQPDSPEIIDIELRKKNNSMGLSIIAASGIGQEHLGIYIKNVVKDGAAAMNRQLQAGDQLLEVDGNSLVNITQDEAAELMKRTGPVVKLKIAKQAAIFHNLSDVIASNPSQIVVPPVQQVQVPQNMIPPPPVTVQQFPIPDRKLLPPITQQNIPIQVPIERQLSQPTHPQELQHDSRLMPYQPDRVGHMHHMHQERLTNMQQQQQQEKQQAQQQMHFQPPPPHMLYKDQLSPNNVNNSVSPLKSPKKVSWVDTQPHQSLHTLIPPSPSLVPSPTAQGSSPPPEIPSPPTEHHIYREDEQNFTHDSYNNNDNSNSDIDHHHHDMLQFTNGQLTYDSEENNNLQQLSHTMDNHLSMTNSNNNNIDDHAEVSVGQPNSNGQQQQQLDVKTESLTLEDIDEVLSSKTHNNWLEDSAGVIGTQEVYNDPRQRIVKERERSNADVNIEKLSFQEKLKMFNISAKK